MRMRYPMISLSLAVLMMGVGLPPGLAARSVGGYRGAPSPRLACWHCSVMAPVRVEMTPLGRRKGDEKGQRRLRVRVMPLVDAPGLAVTLTLPPGVTLAGTRPEPGTRREAVGGGRGEARWQAVARAQVAQTRELLLNVPATGEQRIVATARLVFPRSLPMAYATSYAFNEKVETARREPENSPSAPLQEPACLPTIPVTHARHSR
jgi:hypothetical protein